MKSLTEHLQAIFDWIVMLQMTHTSTPLLIFSIYAPNLVSSVVDKMTFYTELHRTLTRVNKCDCILLLGDFNARVGSDNATWTTALGKFGCNNMNANGKLLLSLCNDFELAVKNTFYNMLTHHYFSWQHPQAKHWHLLDCVVMLAKCLKSVCITRAIWGADCSSDHILICSKLKVQPCKHFRTKKPMTERHAYVAKLDNYEVRQTLDKELYACQPEDTAEVMWTSFKTSVTVVACETLDYKEKWNADWFNDSDEVVAQLLREKRHALWCHLSDPSNEQHLILFRQAKTKRQRELKSMEHKWLEDKCELWQLLADCGNSKDFSDELKSIYDPQSAWNCPILDSDVTTMLPE